MLHYNVVKSQHRHLLGRIEQVNSQVKLVMEGIKSEINRFPGIVMNVEGLGKKYDYIFES